MSARSYICKRQEDGSILGIYCHHGGYMGHNGKILTSCYNTPGKVDELLSLGDLSVLGENMKPQGSRHNLYNPEPGVCVAYGRDADCENTKAKLIELDNKRLYPWVEYVYLYENEQWKVTAIKEDRDINFVNCYVSQNSNKLN